jgi:hypothetical protein
MLVTQIGLMDTTGTVDAQLMETAAAAFNLQVTRDLPQFWPIAATVIHLSNPRRVPPGVWPVQLVRELPPGEGGLSPDQTQSALREGAGHPRYRGMDDRSQSRDPRDAGGSER